MNFFKYFNIFLAIIFLLSIERIKTKHLKMNYDKLIKISTNYDEYLQEIKSLIGELLFTIKINKCYGIITDEYHKQILTEEFFKKSSYTLKTAYLANINELENLNSPNYQTVKILKGLQLQKCEIIFLLLLDGIQTKGLLNFITDNRILNVNTKFVLFYDKQIFTLENIWRKIINVICIRRRIKINRINGKKYKIFELSTIPFPHSGKYLNKKINEWLKGKFLSHKNLFPNKVVNLEGIDLKAAVYNHIPMVINRNQTSYFGLEISIVEALAKIMNFNIEFYKSNDWETERWGRLLLNGTYTGLIGEIANNRADFALGDLHYDGFHLNYIDFSIPHTIECLTFLTPESTADNSWKTLILPFSGEMWTAVLLNLIIVGGIFFIISSIHLTILRNKFNNFIYKDDIFDKFSNCILLTYSMILLVTLPKMPKRWPIRILTGFYWIYCILVVVTYRASFTAILANPAARITIDSVDELAQSDIVVGVWGTQNKVFFEKSFDYNAQKIGDKLEIINDEFSSAEKIAEGKYAYYDNEYFLRYLRSQRIKNNSEEEILHIMNECVVHMPISLGLEKNSPLKLTIDKYIRRLIEGGLVQKWLKDSTNNLKSEETPPQEALMDLKKFSSSFVALAIGFFFSVIALISEILYFEYVVKKHPVYDKYNMKEYYNYKKNNKFNETIQFINRK